MAATGTTVPTTPITPVAPVASSAPPRLGALLLGLTRISLAWILLWAGLDKLFGLGLPTAQGSAVVVGVSPTVGFLTHALDPEGPAAPVLGPMAGNIVIDILFMAGLLGCGLAILLGVVMRLAVVLSAVLWVSIWFASLPLENNPFLDQHLFMAVTGLALAALGAGRYLGFGTWWTRTAVVRRVPLLT